MKGRIRVVVVDDMRVERLMLKSLVRLYDRLELVGEAENALDGAKKIRMEKPDVVFLDVHMPGDDGFGLLQSLETPHVVFAGASPRYAGDTAGMRITQHVAFVDERVTLSVESGMHGRSAFAGGRLRWWRPKEI